jgi:hypothetical protein
MKSRSFMKSAAQLALAAIVAVPLLSAASAEQNRDDLRLGLELKLEQSGPILVHRAEVVVTGSDLAGFLGTIPPEHRWGFVQAEERVGRTLENLLLQQALFKQALAGDFLDSPEQQVAVHNAVRTEIARRYLVHLAEQEKLANYEQQARELYLSDPEAFRLPPTWTFRHVLLTVPTPAAEIETLERIVALHERISAGSETLEAIALAYSEDETVGDNSGLLAGIQLSQLDPQFAVALESLAPGELSAPVRSQFGWHLIELVAQNQGVIPEFDEIRAELEFQARERHRDRVVERVSSELFARGGYVHQEALNAFLEDYLDQLNP